MQIVAEDVYWCFMKRNFEHKHIFVYFCLIFHLGTICSWPDNSKVDKGYTAVIICADEVAVTAGLSGTAPAIVNMDPMRTTILVRMPRQHYKI